MEAQNDFNQIARSRRQTSFIRELWDLMRQQRKYWLLPLVLVLLMIGGLVALSGTALAPFIYTLF
jgi:hypothetical protein